jgi:nitrous oxidase accessory protein
MLNVLVVAVVAGVLGQLPDVRTHEMPADARRTHVVAGGTALQRVIDVARAGDTIRVSPGVYAGPLVIRRPLVLQGEFGAQLDGGGQSNVVRITADSVVLRGFTIRGSGRSLTDDEAAVKLVRCRGCVVEDNRIEQSLHGVYLLESRDIGVVGNTIEGDATVAEARRGNGIHLFHSTNSRLARNTIRRTRDGIYFSFAAGNTVEDNDVARVRYGLHYMYSDDNVFRGNLFTRNAAGAAIMFSRRIVFDRNVFAEHIGYRAYGILLQTAYEVEATGNRIEGNLVGLFLDMSEGNTFRNNVIVGNGTGIDLIPSAEDNTFAENVITQNRVAVRIAGGAGANRWAVNGRGNYWGERSSFDLDGDGVGDRPYRVGDPFSSLAALRPVLEVFAGTPAAWALSWAEQAFPVFDLPRAEDPSPLTRPPIELTAMRMEKR